MCMKKAPPKNAQGRHENISQARAPPAAQQQIAQSLRALRDPLEVEPEAMAVLVNADGASFDMSCFSLWEGPT